jgi:hypothetical protein
MLHERASRCWEHDFDGFNCEAKLAERAQYSTHRIGMAVYYTQLSRFVTLTRGSEGRRRTAGNRIWNGCSMRATGGVAMAADGLI